MSIGESMQQQAEQFRNRYMSVKEQIGRVIVGHDDIVHGVLTSMFIGGHCLLEGVPGLGQPLLVRTLAETLNLPFNRIQFTPDLMPSDLEKPFFVMATQNPIEQEGTYPLPEAQLDRFLFKLVVGYSGRDELATIVDRTTKGVAIKPEKVMDGAEIRQWQRLIRDVILASHVQDYIVRLILATHPSGPFALPITNQYLRW